MMAHSAVTEFVTTSSMGVDLGPDGVGMTGDVGGTIVSATIPGSYPTVNERTPVEIPFFGWCEGICIGHTPRPTLDIKGNFKFALWCGWEGAWVTR